MKSVQWGVDNENKAIKIFEEAMKVVVSPTGLWLDPSGTLGASPDGLVGDEAIVEVKCPFKHRMNGEDEILADHQYCLDNFGQLKQNHPYYHQIQGQLAICNKKKCYLIIWTPELFRCIEI